MKKLILPFIAVIAVLILGSCSEKFKVAAPYKDVTVVYGFLDMNDTAHYIRIEKGFLDENKSSLTMAKVADSSYYANLSVRIERYWVSTGKFSDSFHIYRVDLAAEGYPKQPGTFFDAPNYAYKFTDLLDPLFFYRIKITNLTTGRVDSADAPVINENSAAAGFTVGPIDDPNANLFGMSFFSTSQNAVYTLDGYYPIPSPYNFNNQPSPVGIVQAIITFNWDDRNTSNGVRTHRSYDYDLGYLPMNGNHFVYGIPDVSLYNALSLGMGDSPAGVDRLIDRCDITVYASTPDYSNYQQAVVAQGTGLTGSDIAPVFTNIKGDNTIGLFTSRAMHKGRITITDKTIDSLRSNSILTHARINGKAY